MTRWLNSSGHSVTIGRALEPASQNTIWVSCKMQIQNTKSKVQSTKTAWVICKIQIQIQNTKYIAQKLHKIHHELVASRLEEWWLWLCQCWQWKRFSTHLTTHNMSKGLLQKAKQWQNKNCTTLSFLLKTYCEHHAMQCIAYSTIDEDDVYDNFRGAGHC